MRDGIANLLAEAQLQHEVLPLDLGAIPDPIDFEAHLEALGNPGNEAADEASGRSPHLARLFRFVPWPHPDFVVLFRDQNVVGKGNAKLTELALGRDELTVDCYIDAASNNHRIFSNT